MRSLRPERCNAFPALNIFGDAAPGRSCGEAMQVMEDIVSRLLNGICFDWTGLSYQERMASTQMGMLYAFSIFVIFLFLAALYESWTVPFSIMLALPLGVISGVLASSFRGLPNDVYFQIGLLTTLGLSTKKAILIGQCAKGKLEGGEIEASPDNHDFVGVRGDHRGDHHDRSHPSPNGHHRVCRGRSLQGIRHNSL